MRKIYSALEAKLEIALKLWNLKSLKKGEQLHTHIKKSEKYFNYK